MHVLRFALHRARARGTRISYRVRERTRVARMRILVKGHIIMEGTKSGAARAAPAAPPPTALYMHCQ